jgi:molybdate transport system substrate-binding protein
MSKQFAATGNADAAFTAYSLVLKDQGRVIQVDEKLHTPIAQALGILSTSQRQAQARQFVAFLSAGEGRGLLEKFGYVVP